GYDIIRKPDAGAIPCRVFVFKRRVVSVLFFGGDTFLFSNSVLLCKKSQTKLANLRKIGYTE
ncbi:MAG: hypothetical protein ACLVK8_02835, partial [Ruminococcus sp.]